MTDPFPETSNVKLTKRILNTAHLIILNWAIVFSGLAVYSGLNALTLIIVARQVTPLEYGQYLASFALASFLVIIPGFGMDAWILTQHSEIKESSEDLWASAVRTRSLLLVIWLIMMIPLASLLPRSTYPLYLLLPTIIGIAFDSLILLSFSALRVRGEHKTVTFLQSTSGVALLVLTLILPLEDGQIALFAIARMLLSLIFVLILFIYLGRGYLRNHKRLLKINQILSVSRTFLWSELASSIYIKADVTIISLVIGPIGTSVYGPAVTILQTSFIFLLAQFFYFVPLLSKTYMNNRHNFANQNKIHLILQLSVGVFLSCILFFLAEPIINLIFSDQYSKSIDVLRLLSPIPLFRSINFALAATLMAALRQQKRTRVQIAAAIFNVVANLIVILPFGVSGVAVIYVISEFFLSIGYFKLVRDLQNDLRIAQVYLNHT